MFQLGGHFILCLPVQKGKNTSKMTCFAHHINALKIFIFPGLTTANMLLVIDKEMHLNQCLLFAAGFILTFAFGMF